MKSLFTVHAGEYLVGEFIENKFKSLRVWVPSKDKGVDLLITDEEGNKITSLQVKLSKDYVSQEIVNVKKHEKYLLAGGWFALTHAKIERSLADFWVFILVSHERGPKPQFIIIRPSELLAKLEKVHGKSKRYNLYLWVTKSDICLDGRNLEKEKMIHLSEKKPSFGDREFTDYLNKWPMFEHS